MFVALVCCCYSIFAVQRLLYRDVPSISAVAGVPSVARTHVVASVPVAVAFP